MSEPNPDRAETATELMEQRLLRAHETAEDAAVLGDDFAVARALSEVASVRLAIAFADSRQPELGDRDRQEIEFRITDATADKELYDSAQQAGEISEKLAERILSYRESVIGVLNEVVDGDDGWIDDQYGKQAGQKRAQYRELIKSAVKGQALAD